ALLELLSRLLVEAERVDIPGVELAQVAGRAIAAEVLLGAVDRPEQLGRDLLAPRRPLAAAGQLFADPGVAERAAGDHHRVGAGLAVGASRRLGALQPAG